ncbi:hypothetical protein [Pseudoalteromonas sp. PAR1]|jgi:hypothetical protein|uniref:hypothetical protein n=1 Tax=unclassified Pseudoalteromonas TaxID=194690 RepID=UPI00248CF030|nr:hypothetical protein [Pseudoalteromonas sp. PAR1]
MKVTLLSAANGKGISQKTGAPKHYAFSSISYLVPEKDFIQGDHQIQKCGFEPKSLNILDEQSLYQKFKNILDQHGICEVDLTLQPDPENMSRNVVSDVKFAG